MKTFILDRPDDSLTHTRVQILKTTLKWMVLLWAGAVVIRVLCTVLVPMTLGCAVTYARVNLGFWWGAAAAQPL
jgi:hypothetical protein